MESSLENGKHPIHGAIVNNFVALLHLLVTVECDVNFLQALLRDGVVYYFVKDDAFLTTLRSLAVTPKSLQMLCRTDIRNLLSFPIMSKIERLPVPAMIKEYIAMKDVEKMFEKISSTESSLEVV